MTTRKRDTAKTTGLSEKQLDALIEEATVDAYDEAEQLSGMFTLDEERLVLPFTTEILGVEVEVVGVELNDGNEVVATCRRGPHRQRVSLLELPVPKPLPDGWETILAYRRWARNWRG